jgi:glycine betaine/choline ABC-type transport system substrate-binding protein
MSAYSCVGRILTISLNNSMDQQIIGHILSVYITERTGTTIEFTEAADVNGCQQAVNKGDADIFINYLGVASANLKDEKTGENPQETFAIIKEYYLQNYKMVWLKPFGYKGPLAKGGKAGGQGQTIAAPVTTKKVLERFPILDRLINKLEGKIDDNTMEQLIKKATTMDPEKVAKDFLKKRNMI